MTKRQKWNILAFLFINIKLKTWDLLRPNAVENYLNFYKPIFFLFSKMLPWARILIFWQKKSWKVYFSSLWHSWDYCTEMFPRNKLTHTHTKNMHRIYVNSIFNQEVKNSQCHCQKYMFIKTGIQQKKN